MLNPIINNDLVRKILTPVVNLYLSIWNRILCYLPLEGGRNYILNIFYGSRLKKCVIHSGFRVLGPWYLSIGPDTNIHTDCFFDARGGLTIGRNSDISFDVKIYTEDHDPKSNFNQTRKRPVSIGDDCVVGAHSIILPGVCIENGCVIGAGSVVTKSVSAFKIYAGNPAREIGDRVLDLDYTVRYRRLFH